ncbi:hypothetical protein D3C71_1384630 [compost metagenome]
MPSRFRLSSIFTSCRSSMLHEWTLKPPFRCSATSRRRNSTSAAVGALRGFTKHSYRTKDVMQKSQRAPLAAEYRRVEDKRFHTEQVSATLPKWNFDGSMAMKAPSIKTRELGEFSATAQQCFGKPPNADDGLTISIETEGHIVVGQTAL